MNASDLLAAYRDTGSEQAFSDLIRHYANLVFSVAKRQLWESTLAEDVTQIVFIRLAKSPPRVASDAELVAWLHRTTVHAAIDCGRVETRRRKREQEATIMQPISSEDTQIWDELSPHLDKALDELSDSDRQAVLLRFFERQPMREIGRVFGVSEDAAKMRVSRAVDRLREQLGLRGVTCTAVLLTTLLPPCSVEAAPAHLIVKLGAIKHSARAAAGFGAISSLMPSLMKSPAFMRVAMLLGLAVATFVFFRNTWKEKNEMTSAAAQTDAVQTQSASGVSKRFLSRRVSTARSSGASPVQPEAKFVLRVVERGTGAGLAGARVRAVYFYSGGVSEGHSLVTDVTGTAGIPQPNNPDRNRGLNMFVSIEGFVPQSISFGLRAPEKDYALELDSAQVVGGTVIDESGRPVSGVAMEAHAKGEDHDGKPSTDFQTTKVTTDSDGRWIYPYVPRNYETVSFSMTCSNYAVTQGSVATAKPESLNALLVIKRGFVVAGRVTDTTGQPVNAAKVKESHNRGHRELSTQTDADGSFALVGIADPGGRPMDLVVEAKGMAPQVQAIPLLEPTNIVNFVLTPSSVFRGRVLDEASNPITNACVRTDFDFAKQIPTRFDWLTHTGTDGRFEWDSAPAEKTCFWFEADGYEVIRGRPMLPDGTDHEIKLTRKTERPESDPDN